MLVYEIDIIKYTLDENLSATIIHNFATQFYLQKNGLLQ